MEYPGRSHQQQDGGALKRLVKIPISPAVLANIKRLRAANTTWPEITALHFPGKGHMRMRNLVLRRMERLYGAANKHTWMNAPGPPRALAIVPADYSEIRRLLAAGMSWPEVTRSMYLGENDWNVRRAFLREEETQRAKAKCQLPALRISLSDIREIQRLRQANTTWQEITRLKFPDEHHSNVRRVFLRDEETLRTDRKGRPAAIELRAMELREIRRMLELKMQWRDITTLLYPEQNWQNVRRAFLREKANHPRPMGRARAIQLQPKDVEKIKHLRGLKLTWSDVAAMAYPGQRWSNVRNAFLRLTAGEATSEGVSAVSNEADEEGKTAEYQDLE